MSDEAATAISPQNLDGYRYKPRRYYASDSSILLIVGPFEDEPEPLSPAARRGQVNELGAPVVTGELLGNWLNEAKVKYADRGPRVEYERYRERAVNWRGDTKKLLPDELVDPRNFEARVCRVDPKGPNAKWFFPLSDWEREQLVIYSRKSDTRYLNPGQLEPGPEFFRRLRSIFFDICRNKDNR